MTDAEKLAALEAAGLTVDPDGRVVCKVCRKGAIWLQDAKAGDWARAGCPGKPPCMRPPIPSLPSIPSN